MHLSVRFNGKLFEVCIEEDATVQHLCDAIEQATGVLARNQKLISKGKALTSSSTPVSATNLKDGSSIMLMASATAGTETQGQAAARQACEARGRATAARLQQQPSQSPIKTLGDRVRGWQTTGVVALANAGLHTVPDAVWEVGTAARVLSMPHNSLSTLPEQISMLPQLQRLLVSHNALVQLPWAALTGLVVLDLGHNRLGQLPDAIGQLSNLTHLCLDYNGLAALPSSLGTLRALCVLRVRGNALASLPPALAGCNALVDLDAAHNALRTLPAELGGLTSLQRLCLDANKLSGIPPEVLRGCSVLRVLQCHDNPLTMEQLRATPGFDEYDARRRAKHDKQVDMKLLNTRFDEGADVERYDRFAHNIHKNRK